MEILKIIPILIGFFGFFGIGFWLARHIYRNPNRQFANNQLRYWQLHYESIKSNRKIEGYYIDLVLGQINHWDRIVKDTDF